MKFKQAQELPTTNLQHTWINAQVIQCKLKPKMRITSYLNNLFDIKNFMPMEMFMNL